MKRSLIPALISFCFITVVPLGEAHASLEQYQKDWMACEGYIKRYSVWWHLHESNGYPQQNLRKSPQLFGTYTHYPPSPFTGMYDWCSDIVPYTYWYWLTDCRGGGLDCRSHDIIPVAYESTYPQPCQVP